MTKTIDFIKALLTEIHGDNVASAANALTYKLLLGVFPFLIFIMTVLGFLNLDGFGILESFYGTLPTAIYKVLSVFVDEVLLSRNLSLLSTSLLVTVFSASSGFRAIIIGINKAYGYGETRGFIKVWLISIGLVLLFTFSIIICAAAVIFGERIIALAADFFRLSTLGMWAISLLRGVGSLLLLLAAVCAIYRIASCKRLKTIDVLPGSLVTVLAWVLASKIFSIYIDNFSRYSVVYGSLGGVFILMLWLNVLAFVLLIGGEINALLEVRD